jgi:hypothetical protein
VARTAQAAGAAHIERAAPRRDSQHGKENSVQNETVE